MQLRGVQYIAPNTVQLLATMRICGLKSGKNTILNCGCGGRIRINTANLRQLIPETKIIWDAIADQTRDAKLLFADF